MPLDLDPFPHIRLAHLATPLEFAHRLAPDAAAAVAE